MTLIRALNRTAITLALLGPTLIALPTWSHAASASTPSRCQETQLDVKLEPGGAGLGHVADIIVFTNISGSNCSASGYPTVKMTNAASVVAEVAKKTRDGYLGGLGGPNPKVPLPVVTLRAHGGTASSMVEGSDVPIGNSETCLIYTKVSITLPRLSPPYHFASRFSGCVRPQVHPIVKGTSGSSGK